MKLIYGKKEEVGNAINYWFNVDGEDWAISDEKGKIKLLNNKGKVVKQKDDKEGMEDLLYPHYTNRIDYKYHVLKNGKLALP